MSYRNNGKKVLSNKLKNKKNIDILDKCIFYYSDNRDQYLSTIYEVIEMISQKVKLRTIISNIKNRTIGIFSEDFNDIQQKNQRRRIIHHQTI